MPFVAKPQSTTLMRPPRWRAAEYQPLPATPGRGSDDASTMAKSLACWFGRHTWEMRVHEGDTFKVCAVCGKSPRGGGGQPKPPMPDVDTSGWKGGV
jgi:hypothetical protein